MREYVGKDNYGRPKSEYVNRLAAMTDEELLEEAKEQIWLSAYANNNPRSDFHWQTDACYDESQRRNRPDIYQSAFDYNVKNLRS